MQEQVPIWVGGRTLRSLRRAVTLADGWMPFGLSSDRAFEPCSPRVDASRRLRDGAAVRAARSRSPTLIDTAQRLTALRDVGATVVTVTVSAESADHYCDQLAALRDLAEHLRRTP